MLYSRRIERNSTVEAPIQAARSEKAADVVRGREPPRCAESLRPRAGLEFAVVTTRAAFDSLEADWNELFRRSAGGRQLFQSFNWLWHWANHYLDGDDTLTLSIVTARRHGRLVLVWPLVAETHASVRKLSWMGEPMSQYGDILVEAAADADDMIAASWQYLKATTDVDLIQLRKVRADAAVSPFLDALEGTVTQRCTACHLDMMLLPNFDAFLTATPAHRQKRRRWCRRRFADLGKPNHVSLTSGPEARRLAEHAIDLKRAWLSARGLLSIAVTDPRAKSFFADVAEAASHPAGAVVEALTCDGEVAAVQISVAAKAHQAVHIVTYAPAYEKVSAGALLFEDSIRLAYERGETVYDFLAPGDDYKRKWTNRTLETRDWAKATTLKGEIYARLYLGFVREVGRDVIKTLPLAWRRRLVRSIQG